MMINLEVSHSSLVNSFSTLPLATISMYLSGIYFWNIEEQMGVRPLAQPRLQNAEPFPESVHVQYPLY